MRGKLLRLSSGKYEHPPLTQEVEAWEAAALVLQEVRQGSLTHVQLLGHLGQFVADAGDLGKGDHLLGGL